MVQLFSFRSRANGTCGNDDYGARRLLNSLLCPQKLLFYSVYETDAKSSSNCRLSLSSTQFEVMGGFAHVEIMSSPLSAPIKLGVNNRVQLRKTLTLMQSRHDGVGILQPMTIF